jgi:pyruvate,orthophosphate dikinase
VPVPPGFTITTAECTAYQQTGELSDALKDEVAEAMQVGRAASWGKTFGDPANPLLVSVRSGAPRLHARHDGHGPEPRPERRGRPGLATRAGDERFAYDSYRRFIQMYGDVVMGVDHHDFETCLDAVKAKKRLRSDTDMHRRGPGELISRVLQGSRRGSTWAALPAGSQGAALGRHRRGVPLLEHPPRHRLPRINRIPEHWGTAVNVQTMVFGNMGDDCATGVAFTRDPSTGENRFYGEFLVNAQGEDVVAGIRTPQHINKKARCRRAGILCQGRADAPKSTRADAIQRAHREALPRHAGHRVHHPGGQAVDAADPQRQAHRAPPRQDRRGHGRRRADHES